VLIWVLGLLLLVWLWRSRGFDSVSGVLGVIGAVVALIPFLPAWLRLGPRPAGSTEKQVRGGALQFVLAVRLQWEEDAKRRRLDEVNDMPVRWEVRPDSSTEAARRLHLGRVGELDELITAFMADPQRLVVVGDPGAGKTAFCLRLALAMCERPTDMPVPVLLPIADWDPDINVNSWLERRISDDYPFLGNESLYGGTLVRSLLEQDRILPLLDGLDELPRDRQAEAVQSLRADLRAAQPFVLTCRSAEFAAVARGTRVFHGLAAVDLLPLENAAAAGYLEDAADGDFLVKWRTVTQELRSDPAGILAGTLTLPLNLFLAGIAYEPVDRDPAELLDIGRFGTREAIEEHLLDAFIPTVFRERPQAESSVDIPRPRAWRSADVAVWLRFLAGYLKDRGAQEFAWWRLTDVVPRGFAMAVSVVVGVAGCSALGVILFGIDRRPLLGIELGTVIGAIGGSVSSLIGADEPRRMVPRTLTRSDLSMRLLLRDLLIVAVAVVVGGVVAGILYGWVSGAAVGAVFGVGFGVVRRLSRPSEPRVAVNPADILRNDRTALLASALFGGLIGAVVGGFLLGVIGGGPNGVVSLPDRFLDALLGAGAGFLAGAGGLGMLVLSTSAWGRFTVARTWLALTGRAPWRLVTFLEDAHDRGVLRHSGPYYQFRHSLLQDRLIDQP
jgi:hypothetical protein